LAVGAASTGAAAIGAGAAAGNGAGAGVGAGVTRAVGPGAAGGAAPRDVAGAAGTDGGRPPRRGCSPIHNPAAMITTSAPATPMATGRSNAGRSGVCNGSDTDRILRRHFRHRNGSLNF
jgi:hypothetical protein